MRFYLYDENPINSLNGCYVGRFNYLDDGYDYSDINGNLVRKDTIFHVKRYWL